MRKVFKLEDLDCANCAAKMENNSSKIDGVNSISISFMTQKMTVDIDDARFDAVMDEIEAVCKKVEPEMTILR